MGNYSVKVIVATHKEYPMPPDPMYLPLHVGAALKKALPYEGDNTGENISRLNPGFCELTGLYWAWKNREEDYIGLVHYRRHFSFPGRRGRTVEDALKKEELLTLLPKYRLFVPKYRWYLIETLYSHYAHTHYGGHLDAVREIIEKECPAYLPAFDKVMRFRGGYMFNMMIMRRDDLDAYCGWLFPILFSLKDRLDHDGGETEQLSAYQARLYGRVSEILFNVWMEQAVGTGAISEKEILKLPYFGTEKTNWMRKGSTFLKAKMLHTKYKGSF